jgi:hypothetical protein
MVYAEYRVSNLEELLEVAKLIQKEVNAHADRDVHPSEIRFVSQDWSFINANLEANKLSDGSLVYDVEVS